MQPSQNIWSTQSPWQGVHSIIYLFSNEKAKVDLNVYLYMKLTQTYRQFSPRFVNFSSVQATSMQVLSYMEKQPFEEQGTNSQNSSDTKVRCQ